MASSWRKAGLDHVLGRNIFTVRVVNHWSRLSSEFPIPGGVSKQAGWDTELPWSMEGVSAHSRGLDKMTIWSIPTQTIL